MHRVDRLPWYLKLPVAAYGYGVGALVHGAVRVVRAVSTIDIEGDLPHAKEAAVYSLWHENLILYFVAFPHLRGQVWMNHPTWHMKPIHVLLKLGGVSRLVLGSTGNDGRAALAEIIDALRQGTATTLACDGPAGPVHVAKPGALLMSEGAHVPIVPLAFSCSRAVRLPGWDRKIMPLPFSRITLHVGDRLYADANDKEAQCAELERRMTSREGSAG